VVAEGTWQPTAAQPFFGFRWGYYPCWGTPGLSPRILNSERAAFLKTILRVSQPRESRSVIASATSVEYVRYKDARTNRATITATASFI
jgi:hypothetical protein